MSIFGRNHKKNKGNRIIVKRGDDVRVYKKAGTLVGIDLQRETTNERDKSRDGKER